ncbi:MAG: hypothetical protein WCA77_00200 [Thermoplasmata archaeon]
MSLPPLSPYPASVNSDDTLRRIEQNTAGTLQWMKILTAVMIVLLIVTVLLFV